MKQKLWRDSGHNLYGKGVQRSKQSSPVRQTLILLPTNHTPYKNLHDYIGMYCPVPKVSLYVQFAALACAL